MKVATTFHQPSSILSSLKCHLSSRDTENLVVGKLNKVIVYSIQPHGLQKECSVDVWGKVLSIKAIPIPRSHRSNLVLMIAHPDPELVFFTYIDTEDGTGTLLVKKRLPLYERAPRPAEFFNDVLVHPSGQLALVSCYTGKLKIIRIKAGNYQDDFDVSVPELNIFSIAFLPTSVSEYAVAILHLGNKHRVMLHARDVLLDDLELSDHPSVLLHPTVLTETCFPFPTDVVPRLVTAPPADYHSDADDDAFRGGILVVGGRKLLLYELAGKEAREKQRMKRRKLEARKSSSDATEVARSREKEVERENRKRKPKASIEWPWSEVAACCSIDQESLRFLIGDVYGRLSMLSLETINETGLVLVPLGETSPATTLTYLTSQVIYVGSHLGDSQVIEISPTPVSSAKTPTLPIPSEIETVHPSTLISVKSKGKARCDSNDDFAMDVDNELEAGKHGHILEMQGSYLSVLDTQKNIAPIMDAVLVDVDGTGQRQIMTCSGGRNTGSLNMVRHGADFEELAYIPGLLNGTGVWAVKTMLKDSQDSHILVSTLRNTSLFRIRENNGIPSLSYVKGDELSGLRVDGPTLAFANVARRVKVGNSPATYENSSLAIQVTAHGVFLLEMDPVMGSYAEVNRWLPEGQGTFGERRRDIVAASVNPSQVTIALHGGKLLVLSIAEKNELRVTAQLGDLSEISAISCTPLDSRNFTTYLAVSYWGKNTVEIFTIAKGSLSSVCKTLPLPSLVRSLLLYNFGSDTSPKGNAHFPYLLVGLSDGSLGTFVWKDKELKEKKIVSLGHAPIVLAPCIVDGKQTVLAAGNRATLVSFDKKRLQFSPVSIKDTMAVSPLNIKFSGSALVLATPTSVSIGRVSNLDKLHIRTIPFGLDCPRRIVYEPSTRAFGVACTETTPCRIGEVEVTRSSFVLLDDVNFTQMSRFWCDDDEEITSVTTFNLNDGKNIPLFCVGTYRYNAEEIEPNSGRILIFAVVVGESGPKQTGYQLSLLASTTTKGCVYALVTLGDSIVAAVNSSLELYQLGAADEDTSIKSYRLDHLSSWNHNYLVVHLATFDNYVLVGDQISSISLVKVNDKKLQSVARDYGPLWPVAVDASSETDIIAANDALNLYTFSLSRQPTRTMLERTGNWHLGDFVTKFIRGSLSHDIEETALFRASELFFTSSGRIGFLLDITDSKLPMQLTALERNMAYAVEGIGGESHTRYRAPKSTRGRTDADLAATGFLDGDFIEQFLTLVGSREMVDKIMAGTSDPEKLNIKVEDLQKVVESLQSMH